MTLFIVDCWYVLPLYYVLAWGRYKEPIRAIVSGYRDFPTVIAEKRLAKCTLHSDFWVSTVVNVRRNDTFACNTVVMFWHCQCVSVPLSPTENRTVCQQLQRSYLLPAGVYQHTEQHWNPEDLQGQSHHLQAVCSSDLCVSNWHTIALSLLLSSCCVS